MNKTQTILDEIVGQKKKEIELSSQNIPLKKLVGRLNDRQTKIRDFPGALRKMNKLKIIAEIKKASPSEGLIKKDFDPVKIAKNYEDSYSVNAISCLTDEKYFQGKLEYISQIKKSVYLPILRKDFIFCEYQVYESYLAEADAILLIVALLNIKELKNLINTAKSLGLHCLVETHSEKEVKKALEANAKIIGINARDLKTFKLNPDLFEELSPLIPDDVIKVAESGLSTKNDLEKVNTNGADAVLIGTSIMKSNDITKKLRELIYG